CIRKRFRITHHCPFSRFPSTFSPRRQTNPVQIQADMPTDRRPQPQRTRAHAANALREQSQTDSVGPGAIALWTAGPARGGTTEPAGGRGASSAAGPGTLPGGGGTPAPASEKPAAYGRRADDGQGEAGEAVAGWRPAAGAACWAVAAGRGAETFTNSFW